MVQVTLELAKEEEQTLQEIFQKEIDDSSELDRNVLLSDNDDDNDDDKKSSK